VRQGRLGGVKPHLFAGEPDALLRHLRQANCYLEFGVGGSTALAVGAGLRRVIAVDSDPAWIARATDLPEIAAAVEAGRAVIRHADIGPVGEWGFAKGWDHVGQWPNYIAAAWAACADCGEKPDLVFVDGRFRVACCLSVILAVGADRSPRVLLHDAERPCYDEVRQFFDVVEQVNTLAVLRIKPLIDNCRVLATFTERQFDQR
jgi:hypothetical protein